MSIRIVFTGDISFTNYFSEGWKGQGILTQKIRDFLDNSDYVVANLECPLTNEKIQRSAKLVHASNPQSGSYLKSLGINVWSIANNHIMDCGKDGLEETLKCAESNCCQVIGAGEDIDRAAVPVILGDDVKVGVVSVASSVWRSIQADKDKPGILTWDREDVIRREIERVRSVVDWIVLVVHGGDEYADLALPYMREKYKAFLNAGADIIVAHHPHVVQNYEVVGEKIIFYSLGNFVFDTENQRDFAHTDNGVLIGIDFKKNNYTFDHLPTHIDRHKQIVDVGETPAVFRDLGEAEYAKLWPLEARNFYVTELKNKKRNDRRWASISKPVELLYKIYLCRNKKGITIQEGRLLSLFGMWRKSSLQSVCGYLMEQ